MSVPLDSGGACRFRYGKLQHGSVQSFSGSSDAPEWVVIAYRGGDPKACPSAQTSSPCEFSRKKCFPGALKLAVNEQGLSWNQCPPVERTLEGEVLSEVWPVWHPPVLPSTPPIQQNGQANATSRFRFIDFNKCTRKYAGQSLAFSHRRHHLIYIMKSISHDILANYEVQN